MKTYFRFFSICVIAAASLLGSAVLAGEKLTWSDCVERVAKSNPQIQSSASTLDSSKSLSRAAYGGFLPKISASANATRGGSYQIGSVPIDTPAGDRTTTSGSVSLNQNLFAGFKDASLVEQTSANVRTSSATLESTKVQVSYDLKIAYAELLYAQGYKDLTTKIIERRNENFGLVELRFEGGLENKGSAMLSKAFVAQAKYDHTVAKHAQDVSRQKLAKVMGMDDFGEFEIAGDMPLRRPDGEPDYKSIAVETPVHAQKVSEEESKRSGVDLARATFYPSLDLTASLTAQGNNKFPNTGKSSLMFNVSLPIFSGGSDYYNLKSASAKYAAASYDRANTDLQLLPNLKQAYKAYVESIEKVDVDKAFVEAAEVRSEIARGKYNNGLMSFEDWDIIENDLINKEKSYLISVRDRIIAEAAWELASGRGVIP